MAMVTTNSSTMLSVHEAAAKLDVSSDTIRRWHKRGLIKAQITKNGARLFAEDEIRRLLEKGEASREPWNVLKADESQVSSIELFCGAGGLALGMHNAGIKSELLVDFNKDSIETLKLNKPKWNSLCASVTDLDLSEYEGKIDVMAGGFPCQAFSFAGNKKGFADTRGTLFYDFARLIGQVKPKLVVGENVKGLLSHDSGRTLSVIVSELEKLGYRVKYRVLRAQFLDAPQKRERLIIIGIRNDIAAPFLFPEEKNYIIPMSSALLNTPDSPGMSYSAEKKRVMDLVPEGGNWRDLPEELQKKFMGASFYLGGGKTGMARRLSWSEPSLTLTCNPAQKQTERCHPAETRPLTVREYARIQCFPDNWQFSGSVSSQYRQIGNAVPVNLGYHVGLAVRAMLGQEAIKPEKPAKLIDASDNTLQIE